jgi:DNA-binding transcriptional LysR family regulator
VDPAQLPALVAFASVARHGSFTRAAGESGVSASALSQSVRTLETQLNVRLFNRTTRRVALTEAGTQFLERVRPALAALESAFDALDETRDHPAGTLRINLPRVASELLVLPHLGEFRRLYPHIRLEMALDDGLADLVAIALGGEIRIVVAGSPGYFEHHQPPQTPDDLAAHDCLHYRFATSGGIYRWEFAQPGDPARVFEVDTRSSFVTNDLRTMVRAAEQGVGLLHVVGDYVREQLADGRLVPVLDAWCPSFAGFYLYTASRAQMPLKLRLLIDFLQGKCKERERR